MCRHCLIGKRAYSIYGQLMLFLSYDGREGRIEKAGAPLSETDSRLVLTKPKATTRTVRRSVQQRMGKTSSTTEQI